jgi:hypothetical protein
VVRVDQERAEDYRDDHHVYRRPILCGELEDFQRTLGRRRPTGEGDLDLKVAPDPRAAGHDGDLRQQPAVATTHARGKGALEAGADAADLDRVIDDVVRPWLSHHDGSKTIHALPSYSLSGHRARSLSRP